jgi:hypothetical protein
MTTTGSTPNQGSMIAPSTRQHRLDGFDAVEDGAVPDDPVGSGVLGEPMTATDTMRNQGAMATTATDVLAEPMTVPPSMLNQGAMPTTGSTRTTPSPYPMIAQVTWKHRFDGFDGDEDGAVPDDHAVHPASSPRRLRCGRGDARFDDRAGARRPRRTDDHDRFDADEDGAGGDASSAWLFAPAAPP